MKTKKPYLTLRLGKLKKNSRDYKNEKRTNYYKYEEKFSADIPILGGSDKTMYWCVVKRTRKEYRYFNLKK